jgi:hypothetical protein
MRRIYMAMDSEVEYEDTKMYRDSILAFDSDQFKWIRKIHKKKPRWKYSFHFDETSEAISQGNSK